MMKEAEYTMDKVNGEFKLNETLDGFSQYVGDPIASKSQGTIIGCWYNPIEINDLNIVKNHLPFWKKNLLGSENNCRLKKVDSIINYLDETTDFEGLFYYAKELIYIKEILSSKVSIFYQTFCGCEKLEEIPELNFAISSVSTMNFTETFKKCYKLKEIRIKNLNGNTFRKEDMALDFRDCVSLSDNSVLNIISNITVFLDNELGNCPYTIIFNKNREEYFNNTYCKITDKADSYLPFILVDKETDNSINLKEYITVEKGLKLGFAEVDSQ